MSEPFLGEIRIVSFGFAPNGWALANGQLLPIAQDQALFALYGTTYGGNGQTTFALPNLQSRTPIHFSSGIPQGAISGEEAHTLTIAEVPSHSHLVNVTTDSAQSGSPTSNLPAAAVTGLGNVYGPATHPTPMNAGAIGPSNGSGLAHENRMPFLTLNFIVALQGIFPSRN